jgi:hypothetical protein
MSKFRKKPVVIDAFEFTGGPVSGLAVMEWIASFDDGFTHDVRDEPEFEWHAAVEDGRPEGFNIPTLEGVMTASPGDWIIRGVQGEFYPCKPDIFEQIYEEE